DLDSTNGTRVNGRPISARVLRPGDQIAVGRCLLAYGSPEELARLIESTGERRFDGAEDAAGTRVRSADEVAGAFDRSGADDEAPPFLPPGSRPPTPANLDLVQQAQLCDLLGHLHEELRIVLTESPEADAGAAALPDRLPKVGGVTDVPPPPEPSASSAVADAPAGDSSIRDADGDAGRGAKADGRGDDGSSDSSDFSLGRLSFGPKTSPQTVPWPVWQRLVRLEMTLAEALRAAGEPD
ncbi:MAG: FHA domain-containing protein, partial [Planctomycetota bacterium]